MAGHIKTEIRDKVADLIQQGVAELATSTKTTRVRPSDVSPWCSVATPRMAKDTGRSDRWPNGFFDVDVEVTIGVKDAAGYDAILDDLEGKVTAVLAAEPTLGGLCKLFSMEDSEDEWDDKLDQPAGRLVMLWRAEVRINATAPQAAIP